MTLGARSFLSVSVISAMAVLGSACGGVVALDDIPREPDGGAGAGNDAGTGNPGSGSTPGSGSGSGSSGGGSGSGGGTLPGSPGSPTPAPTPLPPPPKPALISCGQTTCNAATQSCCIDQNDTAACVSNGGQCAGVALDCSSRASCPSGQVCCLDIQGIPSSSCTSTCNTGGGGPGGSPMAVILCDSDKECPQGMRCRDAPGGEDFGIKFCRPRRGN